jgi:hypothetical protein
MLSGPFEATIPSDAFKTRCICCAMECVIRTFAWEYRTVDIRSRQLGSYGTDWHVLIDLQVERVSPVHSRIMELGKRN